MANTNETRITADILAKNEVENRLDEIKKNLAAKLSDYLVDNADRWVSDDQEDGLYEDVFDGYFDELFN